jgi:hypothetical protein
MYSTGKDERCSSAPTRSRKESSPTKQRIDSKKNFPGIREGKDDDEEEEEEEEQNQKKEKFF